jgi:hypothetical protein
MKVKAQLQCFNGESKAFTLDRESEYFAVSSKDLYFPTLYRIFYKGINTFSEISLKVYVQTEVYFNVKNFRNI